jgi:hypothetical protein
MEKDLGVLLDTTNDEIFEEQAKNWPGVDVFRKCAWECICGEPDCFRTCIQSYSKDFPDRKSFAQYLEEIVGIQSRLQLMAFTSAFGDRMKRQKALH